ncbi:MAG: protein-L-isoaspartate O-methyltransferase [Holosporales bacterium]|jgi:protein-L-isoaspartate(D-aspartate) O-methyltransferase|nr:protein-L-isoaspartate O-methyltransferase [Holosporales bacterium]
MILKLSAVLGLVVMLSELAISSDNSSYYEQDSEKFVPQDNVESAFLSINRAEFLDPEDAHLANLDQPISIGYGQTTSQPSLMKNMVRWLDLRPGDSVLEIGTGSGYLTAVLAKLANEVYTVEIIPELFDRAMATLTRLGVTNVYGRCQNAAIPWGDGQRFDKIIVSAACKKCPQALLDQLNLNGIIIIPMDRGEEGHVLVKIEKDDAGNYSQTDLCPVRFVPFIEEEIMEQEFLPE